MGVPYEVVATRGEEQSTGRQATLAAEQNALNKVMGAVLPPDAPAGAFVLGTDTVVVIDGVILGKPRSQEEAREMLTALEGRTHLVISGVALMRVPSSGWSPSAAAGSDSGFGSSAGSWSTFSGQSSSGETDFGQAHPEGASGAEVPVWVDHSLTRVTFRPLQSEDIAAYVSSREWVGKAGGYAIQGLAGLFVETIEGEYSNVVGLPLCLLRELFCRAGFDLLKGRWV